VTEGRAAGQGRLVSIDFRPLNGAAGLDRLAMLHAACFEPAWSRETLASLIASPGVFGVIAESAGGSVGFILCRHAAGEAEILSLGVSDPYRRRGIAKGLLDTAMRQARSGGAQRLFLEVAEDNLAALALYLGQGFAAVGRRQGYYRRGEASCAALVLTVGLDEVGRL